MSHDDEFTSAQNATGFTPINPITAGLCHPQPMGGMHSFNAEPSVYHGGYPQHHLYGIPSRDSRNIRIMSDTVDSAFDRFSETIRMYNEGRVRSSGYRLQPIIEVYRMLFEIFAHDRIANNIEQFKAIIREEHSEHLNMVVKYALRAYVEKLSRQVPMMSGYASPFPQNALPSYGSIHYETELFVTKGLRTILEKNPDQFENLFSDQSDLEVSPKLLIELALDDSELFPLMHQIIPVELSDFIESLPIQDEFVTEFKLAITGMGHLQRLWPTLFDQRTVNMSIVTKTGSDRIDGVILDVFTVATNSEIAQLMVLLKSVEKSAKANPADLEATIVFYDAVKAIMKNHRGEYV